MNEIDDEKLTALRTALIEGERSGPPEPLDWDAFLAEMRGKQAQDSYRVGTGLSPR